MALAACAAPAGDPAVAGPPTCDRIEAFAEQLVDVGITYDQDPSADRRRWRLRLASCSVAS